MKPHPQRRGLAAALRLSIAVAAVSAGALIASSGTAWADPSSFGCKNLAENQTVPAIEGKNGFFFRIFADLRMQNVVTDRGADVLARLSAALKRNGTTLIYAPVPTKGQTLTAFLPEEAKLYGFDPAVAIAVYKDQIKRLRDRGVVAVDLIPALTTADPQHPTFFQADFHWTSEGARRSAEAVAATIKALPDYAGLTPHKFETTEIGDAVGVSTMRRTMQPYCVESLPLAKTMAYKTEEVQDANASVDIFGANDASSNGGEIVLVGTSFSDAPSQNFGGFLAQYSGLPVSNVSVTGGNQFGSVTSYITSREFTQKRPRYLIWENPVYNSLAEFGPTPMDELIAASNNQCTPLPKDAVAIKDNSQVTVNLAGLKISPSEALFADAGNEGSRDLVLEFRTSDGNVMKHEVHRSARQRGTGRFFTPFEILSDQNLEQVVLKFDRISPSDFSVGVCTY
jgi:alginate biosynthesis protein AlgX